MNSASEGDPPQEQTAFEPSAPYPDGLDGGRAVPAAPAPQAAPAELDLRGMDSIEAISVLDQYLDLALRTKRSPVRIIHGKGTGAVRNAVRSYLKRSRYVKSFRPGRYGEGEDGVTVVTLK